MTENGHRPVREVSADSIAGAKLWLIGINYAPDGVGIAPYTTQLAEHLTRRGADVRVTTGIPYYPAYRVAAADRWVTARSDVINGVPVRRLRHSVPRKMTAGRRTVHEASFLAHVVARRPPFKPDAIIGVTPALSGAVAASYEAKRLGVPYMIVVQDLVGPGVLQSGISGGRSIASLTARLEAHALRHASAVTILHDGFRDYVTCAGVRPEYVHVVRNWSYAVPAVTPPDEARRKLGWPEDWVIALYAGNMGLKMGLENVVEAARLAQTQGQKLLYVLLGDGSQRAELVRAAAGIDNVRFEASRFGSDFADALAAADVLLINERTTVSNMSLPSKLAYYFTSGRPVLAAVAPDGTTALEVANADAGVVIKPGNPALLLEETLALGGDEERSARFGQSGLAYAAREYDRDAILARYESIIAGVVSGRTRSGQSRSSLERLDGRT